MISRRTSRILGEVYSEIFQSYYTTKIQRPSPRSVKHYYVTSNKLYDFLFDNNYPSWFCGIIREINDIRELKDFIMQLHTGESFQRVKGWSLEQIEKMGQKLLLDLSRDIIFKSDKTLIDTEKSKIDELRSSLELDGYTILDDKILISEQDVIDVKEETDYLSSLYKSLELENYETAFHHLRLSEEHYINHKWDDSISNSRKFYESVLQEVANKNSLLTPQNKLSKDIFDYPAKVRDYLEKENMLEKKEKDAISSVYSLLSHTGSHPYMAQNEQARLLRHLALTFSQFVMLRLKGKSS